MTINCVVGGFNVIASLILSVEFGNANALMQQFLEINHFSIFHSKRLRLLTLTHAHEKVDTLHSSADCMFIVVRGGIDRIEFGAG